MTHHSTKFISLKINTPLHHLKNNDRVGHFIVLLFNFACKYCSGHLQALLSYSRCLYYIYINGMISMLALIIDVTENNALKIFYPEIR